MGNSTGVLGGTAALRLPFGAGGLHFFVAKRCRPDREDALGSGMKVLPMFLNGAWTESLEGATREIHNPANNEVIAIVADGSLPDVETATHHARRAFDEGPW